MSLRDVTQRKREFRFPLLRRISCLCCKARGLTSSEAGFPFEDQNRQKLTVRREMRPELERDRTRADLAPQLLYGDSRAIKLRECESRERLVIGVFLVSQDADCHRFAEQYGLCRIRAPVQTCDVAGLRDIACKLVQFAGEHDLARVRTRVRRKG